MTKKLDVPVYKQTDMTCGPASLRMVLAYYGIHRPLSAIVRATDMRGSGAYMGEMGRILIKYGIASSIIMWLDKFPNRFYGSSPDLNHDEMLRWAKRDFKPKRERKFLRRFIESGGIVYPRSVQLTDLINSIELGHPPILNFNPRLLYGKSGRPTGHYAPVVYADKRKVVINDPYFGETEHETERALFACHSWSSRGAIFPTP